MSNYNVNKNTPSAPKAKMTGLGAKLLDAAAGVVSDKARNGGKNYDGVSFDFFPSKNLTVTGSYNPNDWSQRGGKSYGIQATYNF